MNTTITVNISLDELSELISGAISSEMQSITPGSNQPFSKPLNGKELCDYLGISEPTLIRYRNKGKIPYLIIGDQYRYNISAVTKALEVNSKKK